MLTAFSENLYSEILIILKKQLSQPSFDNWTNNTELLGINENILYIKVPNDFAKNWLNNRHYRQIKQCATQVLKQDIEIIFVTEEDISDIDKQNTSETKIDKPNINNQEKKINSSYLNPKYTFELFVVGNSNRFAHAASLAVSESPGKTYNPLFIYGGVGLGKTHLMQAIGHAVKNKNNNSLISYVSSEKFTNELISSIREDKMIEFRDKYRNMDVLLIDDIQFLVNKERTQEEFFHTFNTLYEANKQIVISSDRPPKEITNMEKRLISRFEWGLITDLQPPDLETRIAILQKKARSEGINLTNDVSDMIAGKIYSNVRELEGALTRLIAYANLHQTDVIDINLANGALKDILPETKPVIVTLELIQKQVADYYRLKPEDLKSKKRNKEISYPRQIAMFLCRELTDNSLMKIGNFFGGRDHTTVIHAIEKIKNDMETDNHLRHAIKDIKEKIISC